jgi:DNA-binding transcriptional regulator YdaS (Cro superfamily)
LRVDRKTIYNPRMDTKTALNEAIQKGGGITAFTQAVGAPSVNAVKQWRISGVPAAYCPTIEEVTGVKCELLRPEVRWSVLRNTQPEAA